MRLGVLALALLCAPRASNADRLEASGFVGLGWFSENTELGNSWAPEQVPNTAPVLGGRLGWVARRWSHVHLVVEGELSIATAFTGDGSSGRMSYFAPVFGWRGHAALRLAHFETVRPHLVAGVGGETIASSSPFMSKETDPVAYWGPGVTVPITKRWQARLDLRHGIMAGRDDGMTSTIELQLGVGATFGTPRAQHKARVVATEDPPAVTKIDDTDTDGDGLPDRLDRCAAQPETVNGNEDGDGCPEEDDDGDGIAGLADLCPDAPEDRDGFADEDGCIEADNDGDGIEDIHDKCPLEAETRNGVDDGDGCGDTIPADVVQALAVPIAFGPRSAKLKHDDALLPVLSMLTARADVRIVITGRPEKAKGEDLAKRRAEAAKWFLVDHGIAADRITTAVGEIGAPVIQLTLAIPTAK